MKKRITGLISAIMLTSGASLAEVEVPVTDGLLIGLDGSDVTMDGGKVQYWNDQAALGGEQNFYQATPNQRPARLTDFTMPNGSTHSVLDFYGVNAFLSIDADSSMETNTITTFAVVRANKMEDTASGYFISTADSNHDRRWTTGERGSPKNTWVILGNNDIGSSFADINLSGIAQDEWCIVSMTWDGAVTGGLEARSLDTASTLKTGSKTGVTSAVYPHVRTRIGCNSAVNPQYYFDGQLAEILVYNRVLEPSDIAQVEQYLKHKYFKQVTVQPPVTEGLLIGLDGSDVSTDSEKIQYWNDQAAEGGAANFYQSSSAYRPAILTNAAMPNGTLHNIADFSGVNQSLSISSDNALSTNTVSAFLVVRANAMTDGNTGYVISSADAVVRWGAGEIRHNNAWFFLARKTDGNAHIPTLSGTQDQWNIASMSWDGVSGNFFGRFLSEADELVADSAANLFNQSTTHAITQLGCNGVSSRDLFFDGQLAEVLIYNRALPENEVQSVEEYLKYKYFKNIPPRGTVMLVQ